MKNDARFRFVYTLLFLLYLACFLRSVFSVNVFDRSRVFSRIVKRTTSQWSSCARMRLRLTSPSSPPPKHPAASASASAAACGGGERP
jgi:hypothetical protein